MEVEKENNECLLFKFNLNDEKDLETVNRIKNMKKGNESLDQTLERILLSYFIYKDNVVL